MRLRGSVAMNSKVAESYQRLAVRPDHLNHKNNAPAVAMIQDGARLHYAMPRALNRAGLLSSMFTEWFIRPGNLEHWLSKALIPLHPSLARAAASRRCDELTSTAIYTNPKLAWRQRRSRSKHTHGVDYYRWSADQVAHWVRSIGLGNASAMAGYIRNVDPSLYQYARDQNLITLGDQIIAPAAIELMQWHNENARWHDWQPAKTDHDLLAYQQWEQQTWNLLDHVTCASNYVREGLISQGVGENNISVIPYPIDTQSITPPDRSAHQGPIMVGYLGAVCLRKGAPYFMQIAKRFKPDNVRFVMIGNIDVAPDVLTAHQGNVELVGRVNRHEVNHWLSRCDMILFPTTCEGSAGAVMEAMASALPIITSPNAGSVVRDGEDGYICACSLSISITGPTSPPLRKCSPIFASISQTTATKSTSCAPQVTTIMAHAPKRPHRNAKYITASTSIASPPQVSANAPWSDASSTTFRFTCSSAFVPCSQAGATTRSSHSPRPR
jgi:glycosyltransferase involved in cell wall biosynthesis